MIRLALILLALIPSTAACAPAEPRFRCTRGDLPDIPIVAVMRGGRIVWLDSNGAEHPITGAPDEWVWSCLPADGRRYPGNPD